MAHQLKSVTFENSSPSPHLLITGGVHGDEFEPVAAIRRLATLLSSGDPSVQSFRGRLTLVPVVNENDTDGLGIGHDSGNTRFCLVRPSGEP